MPAKSPYATNGDEKFFDGFSFIGIDEKYGIIPE